MIGKSYTLRCSSVATVSSCPNSYKRLLCVTPRLRSGLDRNFVRVMCTCKKEQIAANERFVGVTRKLSAKCGAKAIVSLQVGHDRKGSNFISLHFGEYKFCGNFVTKISIGCTLVEARADRRIECFVSIRIWSELCLGRRHLSHQTLW